MKKAGILCLLTVLLAGCSSSPGNTAVEFMNSALKLYSGPLAGQKEAAEEFRNVFSMTVPAEFREEVYRNAGCETEAEYIQVQSEYYYSFLENTAEDPSWTVEIQSVREPGEEDTAAQKQILANRYEGIDTDKIKDMQKVRLKVSRKENGSETVMTDTVYVFEYKGKMYILLPQETDYAGR